jgi:hypothetical protein
MKDSLIEASLEAETRYWCCAMLMQPVMVLACRLGSRLVRLPVAEW